MVRVGEQINFGDVNGPIGEPNLRKTLPRP